MSSEKEAALAAVPSDSPTMYASYLFTFLIFFTVFLFIINFWAFDRNLCLRLNPNEINLKWEPDLMKYWWILLTFFDTTQIEQHNLILIIVIDRDDNSFPMLMSC